MEVPDNLLCLFTAEVEERRGTYVIEVPANEAETGDVQPDQSYRVAVLPPATGTETEPEATREQGGEVQEPPVREGETVEVEVEDIGEQGDGLARIDRGYIVFVPDTDIGDRVTVEITDVRQNFAFGEVIEGPY